MSLISSDLYTGEARVAQLFTDNAGHTLEMARVVGDVTPFAVILGSCGIIIQSPTG